MQRTELLQETLFYVIDGTIKRYRQLAQHRLVRAGLPITVDQWLVLNVVKNQFQPTQTEIGDKTFKDQASVARILALLEREDLITVGSPLADRRRMALAITSKGEGVMEQALPTVLGYRQAALQGISHEEIETVKRVLEKVISNCQAAAQQTQPKTRNEELVSNDSFTP